MNGATETRDEILHAPSLFDFFCARTAQEVSERRGVVEANVTSYTGIVASLLLAAAFWIFGKPALAQACLVFCVALLVWTVWGAAAQSSERIDEKADSIRGGIFPPSAAPAVIARLKWWNHLIAPRRWGRHSRLFDRRVRLERKIAELGREIAQLAESRGVEAPPPPEESGIFALAEEIQSLSERKTREAAIAELADRMDMLQGGLLLHMALLFKLNALAEKLDRIEQLELDIRGIDPENLSEVVGEAMRILEERRLLVLNVDQMDPATFVDLVTVRSS